MPGAGHCGSEEAAANAARAPPPGAMHEDEGGEHLRLTSRGCSCLGGRSSWLPTSVCLSLRKASSRTERQVMKLLFTNNGSWESGCGVGVRCAAAVVFSETSLLDSRVPPIAVKCAGQEMSRPHLALPERELTREHHCIHAASAPAILRAWSLMRPESQRLRGKLGNADSLLVLH